MMPTTSLPVLGTLAGFRRFTVAEYHRLTEIGLLTEDDNLELIEGYLVLKMARNPPQDGRLHRLMGLPAPVLPAGWELRVQSAITLADCEPEPDLAVVVEEAAGYTTRHPGPSDVGLVVEVSDSTLAGDRADKGRIYARAGLPEYRIVDLPDRQVKVYNWPGGTEEAAAYRQRRDYQAGDDLDVVLAGQSVARLAVADIFR